MREMKDSGIEWIGDVPRDWEIVRVKEKYSFNTGFTPDTQQSNYYNDENGYEWATIADIVGGKVSTPTKSLVSRSFIEQYHKKIIKPNSLLYSFKLSVGQTAITDRPMYTNEALASFEQTSENNISFFKYSSMLIEHNANTNIYGAKILNQQLIKNAYVTFPSLQEQRRIADFLDEKCDEIDSLTKDIQEQIMTLEEYKKSIITEAVTKGIHDDVHLVDSGKEWCPQIPEHWIPTNPKALFTLRNQRATPGERQLTASQKLGIVYQDEFMESEGQKLVTVEKDFSILKHVEPNDFVISMRSFQGGLEYSELSGSISSAYVMLIPDKSKVYPPFYRWFFKSSKYINAIQSTTNLIRDGQAMRYANFVKVPLFLIPIDEQKEIAEFLNAKVERIDSILADKKSQVSVLLKYKKSLIYEYVTGKKEVPVNE